MRRLIITAVFALPAFLAYAQPVRVPVKVYLISPADQPDRPTILSGTKQVTHEVKHVATSWGGRLFEYLHVGSDCQPTGLTFTVLKSPQHGTFTTTELSIPPWKGLVAALPKMDPRAACSRLPVRIGSYRSERGFLGRDYVTVSFQEGDVSFTDNIEIDVRRAERLNPLDAARAISR